MKFKHMENSWSFLFIVYFKKPLFQIKLHTGNSSATWYGHSDGIWHVTCGVIDGMDIVS